MQTEIATRAWNTPRADKAKRLAQGATSLRRFFSLVCLLRPSRASS